MTVARSTDFVNGPLTGWGVTVSRTPVTISYTANGDESVSNGTPANITAIFHKKKPMYDQSEEGLMTIQHAYLMVAQTQALNKNDKITYQSETWRVTGVVTRGPAGSVGVYKYADMELIS